MKAQIHEERPKSKKNRERKGIEFLNKRKSKKKRIKFHKKKYKKKRVIFLYCL
jgi:hypothetical protein